MDKIINKQTEDWVRTKSKLINNIDKTIESGSIDIDILQEMKRLLENSKVKESELDGEKTKRMELL
jgi:hypothetical protein